jgi:DNA repair protein RecN (Recombination protein N)
MLTHIQIRDFAIIDELEVEPDRGMTALTGETGAGKSILVDALGLILGDRADSAVVRHGAHRAEINATFSTTGQAEVERWLVERDLDAGDQCVLRRVIGRDGRSKAYVNGSLATLQDVRELGQMLVDIHGQHEHQSLTRRDAQRDLLDGFAANETERAAVAETYRAWREMHERVAALSTDGEARAQRVALLRFQLGELEALDLQAGELEELGHEHDRLAHAGRLLETTQAAYQILYESEDGSIDSLVTGQIAALESIVELDPVLEPITQLLSEARIQIREAADQLRRYAETLELDPARLTWVEQRLSDIHDLARKHRVEPGALTSHRESLAGELATLEGSDYDLDALRSELAQRDSAYLEAAGRLSRSRIEAARRLNQAVTQAMQGLGMEGGHFEIALSPDEERYSPHGLDRIEFQVTANPGQPVQPLSKVASGGELSRISLAIQMIGARDLSIPTLIFDEVDAGIGGAVAEVVGRQLRALGDRTQVLCVTHLPQVAAQAHQHLQITKQKSRETTRTGIELLDESRRVREIARMLGGIELTDQSLAHAREMIERGQSDAG